MSDSSDDPNLISTPLERTTSLDEEPKQPSNIPNALDHALRSIDLASNDNDKTTTHFTSKDVKYLFSGAPHFMLEKGRHNHWYPHALFPWDVGAVSIQDFWDREAMRHEAFTLGTLHAHLPVPGVHHETEREEAEAKEAKGAKRSTFDLGIFEVPNMLSMNGKERGAVGIRHFLELPIADERRYRAKSPKAGDGVDHQALNNMHITQAFEKLEHMRDAYSECNQDAVFDRRRVLSQGPEAWKRIGVRDVHIKKIVERLIELSEFRTGALEKNKNMTILDKEPVATLHEQLYTHVLYPPPKCWGHHHGKKQDEENLKSQIEVLTKVLAVKGAWLDFSIPDSRLRVGQVLWEMPADPTSQKDHQSSSKGKTDAERKWLLLQLLLAGELLMRLDAIVRLAVLKPSKNISVSSQDVRDLDKLRHGKVNWDVLLVQRFMDNLKPKYCPSTKSSPSPPQEKAKRGLLAKFGRRQSQKPTQSLADSDSNSAWDCIFTPHHAERQLQGLSVFAAGIDWPNRDTIIGEIRAQINKDTYNTPLTNHQQQENRKQETLAPQYVLLRHEPSSSEFKSGWLSRAWLTGFVLPGNSINALLMASILENDPSALSAIGSLANLQGGFSYMGASWWSTKCIAGRVLAAADESKVCMGWVKVSKEKLTPRDQASGAEFGDTWFSVAVRDVKKSSCPRIRQGPKLAIESHPLGHGEVSGSTFTIPVDQQQQHGFAVTINSFDLAVSESSSDHKIVSARQASISFSLTEETAATPISLCMPLTYNIHFISSFPCRPPRGSVHHHSFSADTASETEKETAANHHNLPGHPLHTSYSYKHIPLSSLRPDTAPPPERNSEPVWILDARCSRDHEVFARAWCAAVGVDAVVGRVGRSCLACCVREARAVEAAVVIRVSVHNNK